jgi:hypothetical protein
MENGKECPKIFDSSPPHKLTMDLVDVSGYMWPNKEESQRCLHSLAT